MFGAENVHPTRHARRGRGVSLGCLGCLPADVVLFPTKIVACSRGWHCLRASGRVVESPRLGVFLVLQKTGGRSLWSSGVAGIDAFGHVARTKSIGLARVVSLVSFLSLFLFVRCASSATTRGSQLAARGAPCVRWTGATAGCVLPPPVACTST